MFGMDRSAEQHDAFDFDPDRWLALEDRESKGLSKALNGTRIGAGENGDNTW